MSEKSRFESLTDYQKLSNTSYQNINSFEVFEMITNQKKVLLECFGGKCIICGYKKYFGALEFHHINPKQKKFTLSRRTKKLGNFSHLTEFINEAHKCVLLCKNCHIEVHNINQEIPENSGFDEKMFIDKISKLNKCPFCGETKSISQKTCGQTICSSKFQYRINWDEIDLVELYKKHGSNVAVGKILNVSDNTIKKRIKIFGRRRQGTNRV
jgi:hypothetical protein